MTDPAALLDIATALALEAGDVLRDRPDDLDADTKTTPTDAVTVMDRASEQVILAGLTRFRPDDRVVAEESGSRAGTSEVSWFVDPLDGTVNYLYGLPQWAVSIAAAVRDEVVAGVVYDISHEQLYTAVKGGGALCNGRVLRCTKETDLSLALIATGFAYAAETRARQADVLREVLPRVRDIRRLGSAALDLCAVAAGQVDAFFETGLQPWDRAAAGLVASESGAVVGRLDSVASRDSITVAGNPDLYPQLVTLLAEAGAAQGDGQARNRTSTS